MSTVPLVLSKGTPTVATNNFARVFGTANPTFTGTVPGAVNGDTFTESFTIAAALTSIVGSCPIVPSVAGVNLANYTVNATSGSLTVRRLERPHRSCSPIRTSPSALPSLR